MTVDLYYGKAENGNSFLKTVLTFIPFNINGWHQKYVFLKKGNNWKENTSNSSVSNQITGY